MKSLTTIAAFAAFTGLVSARKCQNITVAVQVSARQGVFDVQALTPHSNTEVTNFVLNLSRQGQNYTASVLQGYNTTSGSYNLSTTYCAPDSGAPNVVQLLTHGIGFDRSYWDLSHNNYNYSYVNEAVDTYGFATLAWDRLGIAQSSIGEPINEIQAFIEVAALKSLTDKLRDGSLSGVPKFQKVLHVGHSFGSQHSYLLSAMYPNATDGVALTGFSQNGSFVPFFAYGANFVAANSIPALKNYPDGYIAAGDASAVQSNFFAPGAFSPDLVQVATDLGQPVGIGELMTSGGETAVPNFFAGPVLIITGERDIPFCGGNCLAPPAGFDSIPAASQRYIPRANPLDVVIVPGAGHGLNLEYSHPFTYGTINNFFIKNGQGPANSTTRPVTPIPTTSLATRTSSVPSSPATYTGGAPSRNLGGWFRG